MVRQLLLFRRYLWLLLFYTCLLLLLLLLLLLHIQPAGIFSQLSSEISHLTVPNGKRSMYT
jgi:hypothetical protein